MKKILFVLMTAAVLLIALAGCDPIGTEEVSVSLQAKTVDSGSKDVNTGDEVTTIDSYNVIFKKVEIGNSEDEKYTLWEDSEGEEMDIAASVNFTDTLSIAAGTYNYLRFEIDSTLAIDGSIDDEGTVYTGSGSCVLGDTTYLFGTDIENFEGSVTITEPIVVAEGTTLVFNFDVAETVFYLSGPSDDAVLDVEKPVISLVVE